MSAPGYTRDEIMTVTAARQLRNGAVCFVGIGLPSAACNLARLTHAPESQRAVAEYLDSVKNGDVASLLDHGRDVLGRVSMGGIIPLSMTMGRTRPDGPNYFAVFRDLSQGKKGESELHQARRDAQYEKRNVQPLGAELLVQQIADDISHEGRYGQ